MSVERPMNGENGTRHEFFEIALTGNEQAWCIDGRPDKNAVKGVQMMGGSLLPIFLAAIDRNEIFDADFVTGKAEELKSAGFNLGVHRGEHQHPHEGKSDCGFADNLAGVLAAAVERETEISRRLNTVYEQNPEVMSEFSGPFTEILTRTYAKLKQYPGEKTVLQGENLIETMAGTQATVENLEGDHNERAAFINVKENTTFDTALANQKQKPAFNLDLWAAAEQSAAIGVEKEFATVAALILYMATEMVLVEDKGKPGLNISVHS